MAINQLNKYVWLVETIHRARKRGGITLKEIQSRWLDSDISEGTELSRRTFINNLHAVEELFGITIECGSGFRYHIECGDCFEEGSARNWLLNAFSLNVMVGNSRKLKDRVLLEDMPSGRNYLEDIIKAMRDNRVIFISYYSYNAEKYNEFYIHPYFVKAFKKRWYVIAYSALAPTMSVVMRLTAWSVSLSQTKCSRCLRTWNQLITSKIALVSSTTRILRFRKLCSKWMPFKVTIYATCLSMTLKRRQSELTNTLFLSIT